MGDALWYILDNYRIYIIHDASGCDDEIVFTLVISGETISEHFAHEDISLILLKSDAILRQL